MERVSVIEGTQPVIFVAPHGPDDTFTADIAEGAANTIAGYAVINQGWEKASVVDCFKDKANCNDVRHCHEPVVKDEFLDPLRRYVIQILRNSKFVYIILIHGLGNEISKQFPDLDVIVGCGRGRIASSFSCKEWAKEDFMSSLSAEGIKAYEGIDGHYAGRDHDNLNQLYVQWYQDARVGSMQVEVIKKKRLNKKQATKIAEKIGVAVNYIITTTPPHYKIIIVP